MSFHALSFAGSPHVRIQRRGQGVRTPLEKSKFIGFPSNTGTDPLKITKLPSQRSMWAIISPPGKRHFYGVSLAG